MLSTKLCIVRCCTCWPCSFLVWVVPAQYVPLFCEQRPCSENSSISYYELRFESIVSTRDTVADCLQNNHPPFLAHLSHLNSALNMLSTPETLLQSLSLDNHCVVLTMGDLRAMVHHGINILLRTTDHPPIRTYYENVLYYSKPYAPKSKDNNPGKGNLHHRNHNQATSAPKNIRGKGIASP